MKQGITIGVLIGNANSPYSMNLIHGIHDEALAQELNLIFYLGIHNGPAYRARFGMEGSNDFDYQFDIIYDNVCNARLDALIIDYNSMSAYAGDSDSGSFLKRFQDIPFVVIGDKDSAKDGISVVFNCYQGMSSLAEHLVRDHGYRRFAMLSGPKNNLDAVYRQQAVLDVLTRYGVTLGEKQIEYGNFTRGVEAQVRCLLDNNPDVQALICANDMMADTAYRVCRERGLRVGEDIAITGYDDWVNATTMDPPLTTVKQDDYRIGQLALRSALDLLQGKRGIVVEMPVELRLRRSCGCRDYTPSISEMTIAEQFEIERLQRDKFDTFKQESWFIPLISRGMLDVIEDERSFFRKAMTKLHGFRIRSSWLFLFPKPIVHERGSEWKNPEAMRLAAAQHGKHVEAYSSESAPLLNSEHRLEEFCMDGNAQSLSVFCLYSGKVQYGILVAEIAPDDIALSYLASMQIANALSYYSLFLTEREMRYRLEDLVTEVRGKNEVLGFLSEYDALTGCLNRRGFIERAVAMNQAQIGQEAILLLADLDHLKEINDNFGHAEGDFAICRASTIIRDAVGSEGLVGRIGGDEFVALLPVSEDGGNRLKARIQAACEDFNRVEEKPFYVEMSMGIKHLRFSEELSLKDALKAADDILYFAKGHRRPSVCRAPKSDAHPDGAPYSARQYNAMTGLPINRFFFDLVDNYLRNVHPEDFCLVAIDIENFRFFNKWFGRSEGDRVLSEIGSLLRRIQEENSGVAGYMGGDDFCILMPDDAELILNVQRAIQRRLRHTANSSGFQPAIGVYKIGDGIMSALNMYDCAKTAQHAVLGHFATRIKVYDSSMIEDLEKELKMITLIKESIDNNEFIFYFQPQCDMATGKVVGAEALIRWQNKVAEKVIMPAEFIPLLEKMGFITDVDLYLWELVCRWLRHWLDMGRQPVPVSINISRVDFFLMDVPRCLKRLIQKYDLPPELLKVEITETSYAEENSIQENVDTLRANGFMVMLDDFGSGYSSMSMLSNIQVDALKIDLKFLQLTEGNRKRGRSIIETLINFSRQLEVPVIIEGVETEQQREFLLSIGCHYAQGYNFYRPMPIEAFEKLIGDGSMIAPPPIASAGAARRFSRSTACSSPMASPGIRSTCSSARARSTRCRTIRSTSCGRTKPICASAARRSRRGAATRRSLPATISRRKRERFSTRSAARSTIPTGARPAASICAARTKASSRPICACSTCGMSATATDSSACSSTSPIDVTA